MSNKQPTIFAKKVVEITFVLVLLVGVATGVVLVNREQRITGRAGFPVSDKVNPTVNLLTPEDGSVLDLSSTYDVVAQAEDDSGVVESIKLYFNDELLLECSGNFCQSQLNSALYPDGSYELRAEATDPSGNSSSDVIGVTID